MILTSLSPVQCAKRVVQVAAAGMDSPPESHDGTETQIPSISTRMRIQAMIDDYTNKEIVQELLQQGFQTSQRSLERRLQTLGI